MLNEYTGIYVCQILIKSCFLSDFEIPNTYYHLHTSEIYSVCE